MYVIRCCEYDDQRHEILVSCCFLGLYIHYRVSGDKVNRSDCEVARYSKMHFRCNVVLSGNLYGTEVPDVASLTVFTYLHMQLDWEQSNAASAH
jgi:hypothetical protein